jgi:aminoglycoside phosphotransferase (APT) family kinase protein
VIAPLRRIDWRFLLPLPAQGSFGHLVVVGGPPGLAHRIQQVGLARHISTAAPSDGSADAVAVLQGGGVTPEAAAACLAPRGVLYYEVDPRSAPGKASTPKRLQKRLCDAGLQVTGTYAVVPDFDSCELYLTLDAPRAFRWYLDTAHTAWTPRQWRLETWSRIAGPRATAFGTLIPCFALTAVAPPGEGGVPSVLSLSALPRELGAAKLHPVLVTAGGDRVVVLPFTRCGSAPIAVLKVPKLPTFNGRTENEQVTLSELPTVLDQMLRRTLPNPRGIVRWGETSVGIESYVAGHSLLRSCGRWGTPMRQKIRELHSATTWLSEFHSQAQLRRIEWGTQSIAEWVEQPLASYRERLITTDLEERLFAAVRRHADALRGLPLPIVWQHGDFSLWNLFRRGDSLSVIDWEGARPGPALCDLLHFLTLWNEVTHRAADEPDRIRVFHGLFIDPDQGGRAVKAARRAVAAYLQRLHLDARFVPLLLVYTWVELTLRRQEQLQLRDGVSDRARTDNRNATYMIPLARDWPRLFGDAVEGEGAKDD